MKNVQATAGALRKMYLIKDPLNLTIMDFNNIMFGDLLSRKNQGSFDLLYLYNNDDHKLEIGESLNTFLDILEIDSSRIKPVLKSDIGQLVGENLSLLEKVH